MESYERELIKTTLSRFLSTEIVQKVENALLPKFEVSSDGPSLKPDTVAIYAAYQKKIQELKKENEEIKEKYHDYGKIQSKVVEQERLLEEKDKIISETSLLCKDNEELSKQVEQLEADLSRAIEERDETIKKLTKKAKSSPK